MEPDDKEYVGRLLMLGEIFSGGSWMDIRRGLMMEGKDISHNFGSEGSMIERVGGDRFTLTQKARDYFLKG